MKDIKQAVNELRETLGYPDWLSAIGHGMREGQPVIILYLNGTWRPRLTFFDEGWLGYPVVTREFGAVAPLGSG